MKKQIGLLSLLLICTLPLVSCNSEQKVTVKDQNGVESVVTIKKSTDEEVIANALMFASQASYEGIDAFENVASLKLDVGPNENEFIKLNTKITTSVCILEPYLNLHFKGEGTFKGISNTLPKDSFKGEINFKMNDSLDRDPYFYIELKEESSETKKPLRYKINSNQILELIFGGIQFPSSPKALNNETSETPIELPKPEEIIKAIQEFRKEMPNTKLEITKVNDKEFNLVTTISFNDILKSNALPNEEVKLLEKDLFIKLGTSFSIKDGRIVKTTLEFDGKDGCEQIFEGNKNITKDARFKISYSSETHYIVPEINRITDNRKDLYIDLITLIPTNE